jgi:hypothetical protein
MKKPRRLTKYFDLLNNIELFDGDDILKVPGVVRIDLPFPNLRLNQNFISTQVKYAQLLDKPVNKCFSSSGDSPGWHLLQSYTSLLINPEAKFSASKLSPTDQNIIKWIENNEFLLSLGSFTKDFTNSDDLLKFREENKKIFDFFEDKMKIAGVSINDLMIFGSLLYHFYPNEIYGKLLTIYKNLDSCRQTIKDYYDTIGLEVVTNWSNKKERERFLNILPIRKEF